MRPTRLRNLAIAAVAAFLLAYPLVRVVYGELPPLPVAAGAGLLLLAVAELATAGSVRARLAGRPGTRPVMPLVVARLAALAKASSMGAAVCLGIYAALLAYTLPERDRLAAAGPDALVSGTGVVGGLLLAAAALVLERACRTPDPPGAPDRP